ncbi:MAG: gliding motility-associated C-terminal domain-containing protein [Saprospiraceae bacterium]|nr:gliding motility-associated C-terminal domain-containing protein [Saprospiraceae bacterium]MCB9342415.1 gliding motility-associated C-terminal domain-containing protein [Lewinellaceae bacterium]
MFFRNKRILIFIPFIFFSIGITAQNGQSFLQDTFCANQTILVVNQLFSPSNPSGTVIIPGGAYNGADSIIHVDFTFNQPVEITINDTLCTGDTLWAGGKAFHANFPFGQVIVQEGAVNGCDSVIHVDLTFTSTPYDYHVDICEGDTIYINGTAYHAFHTSGTEVISNGLCDSIINVTVNAITPPFSNLVDTLCPDEYYIINGTRYDYDNRSGYEILPNASVTGCDSIVAIDLEFRELWVYIGEDRELIIGDTVCITPLYGLTPLSLQWLPTPPCADSLCLDNCIQPLDPVSFTLLATDVSGCVLRDDIHISISSKSRVYAPNAFNPDASEPNNHFYLSCDMGVVNIKRMFIADRWGELLYDRQNISPNSPLDGWDGYYRGEIMHPDTYIFWAELERIDGSTFIEKGGFSLIR